MYIAHSALRNLHKQQNSKQCGGFIRETKHRYNGYLAACKKHSQTIADIQRYMPGWEPHFSVGAWQ